MVIGATVRDPHAGRAYRTGAHECTIYRSSRLTPTHRDLRRHHETGPGRYGFPPAGAGVLSWCRGPHENPEGTARRRRAMRQLLATLGIVGLVLLMAAPGGGRAQIAKNKAAQSPWGPADEIGALNMMTDASRLAIL